MAASNLRPTTWAMSIKPAEPPLRGLVRNLGVAAVLGAASLGAAAVVVPSTQLTVSGAILHPTTYDATSLALLSSVTQTDTFTAGAGAPQTHIYSGPTLQGLLTSAGVVTSGAKNEQLNRIVVATGTDGYRVVYALGEMDPNFGNRQYLAATAETIGGVSQPLSGDGFARLTAPGDVKGGRYVSNLESLDVRGTGSTLAALTPGVTSVSTSFSVSGTVAHPATFDLAALQALPSITETIGSVTYTGVSLWSFLSATAGLSLDPNVKNDVLNHYVVATGTDGYKIAFSLGELSPDFGNQQDMIAYEANGVSLGSNGFARIVVPGDVKAGRWVSNLEGLEVVSASATVPVPEPQAWALMLAGLAGLSAVAKAKARRARSPIAG